MDGAPTVWPNLSYLAWRDTAATLQLWTQIVGKIRLTLTPWLNHSWQVPLYVSARGLGTSPIPVGNEILEIEFDFISQRLVVRTSQGEERALPLEPHSVAEFYRRVIDLLNRIGVAATINETPNEVPTPIRFPDDRIHASYDPDTAHTFWRRSSRPIAYSSSSAVVLSARQVPSIFSGGSFDLAVTRFSGRRAPLHPSGVPGLPDAVTREAYSHEVSSAGFWPGNDAFPRAAFYSYAYPEPAGFRYRPVTAGAYYDTTLGECILPYDAVRTAGEPDALLLDFLSTTYAAAAEAGGWDRAGPGVSNWCSGPSASGLA